MSARVDPTSGPVRSSVLRLAVPAVFAMLIQGLFNIVDTFWVGRGLGPVALAGISTAGFFVWMTLSLANVPEVGLTAVASRRHGEGDPKGAAEAVYQAVLLAIGVSALVGAAGLAGLSLWFRIMDTPGDVTVQGAQYLSVYFAGTPIVFLYFAMDAAFRAAGDTRTPLALLSISLGLNIVLDPFLILGLGPFPRLGVLGAALATLLTRSVGLGLGFVWLSQRGLIRRCRPRLPTMRTIGWVGLPAALSGVVFSAVYVLLTRMTSQFGTPALAALGVGHKVESIGFMICVGFGLAAATAVGQNLGAGKPERAHKSGVLATGYAALAMGGVGLVLLLFPQPLIGVFTNDPAVLDAGASYLRIVAAAQLFMALDLVLQIAMEGAGYTLAPMLVSGALTVLRLPLAALLLVPLGLTGIWLAISVTAMLKGIAMAWLWHRGTWKLREV
ncbi:MAG: MATE family efflux transporter [Gemmatimonadota bacterium]